ncbi:MAG: hypothetical protein WC728_18025 [Elusimicrobiota bacterium]
MLSLALLLALDFTLHEEPVTTEAAFAERYGFSGGCDLTGLAARAEKSLSLPVQKLRPGFQRVFFRYVETGWPLGFGAGDGERPIKLGRKPEAWFSNLPERGGGVRGYGSLQFGPDRFAFLLDGEPRAWGEGRLWIAKGGDFKDAVPLKSAGSPGDRGFAAPAVLNVDYPRAGAHPVILWVFADPKGERIRYYSVSHWRAEVEFVTGLRARLALYDFRGTGDYSMNPMAVADPSRSGGETHYREPSRDIYWKPRGLLGVGRALRLGRETVRLKAISPKGDWADVEIEAR